MVDYSSLGFKCGLEIHQQLEGEKLFCSCPTSILRDDPDFLTLRRLRASAGESGSFDKAAKFEQSKQKSFVYQGYHDSVCLVELDEEPPHNVNLGALRVAVQVAKLLNCKVVDRVLFMRKTVVDGSNTSAFQRTALIGRNGFVEVNGKKIGVDTVCLEEEACQVIERTATQDTYNLSRLGIPLIEVATDASISNPEECKAAAYRIGMILRSVPGMKRGIGSIRQDVNVSIKGLARTEIKGFQEYKSIPKVIEGEVNRRLKLLGGGKSLVPEVRKAESDFSTSFLRPMPGADRMYPETDVTVVIPDVASIEGIELLDDKVDKFKSLGLGKDLASKIVKSRWLGLFERLSNLSSVKAAFLAEVLVSFDSEIKKKYKDARPELIKESDLVSLFKALSDGKIAKSSVLEVLSSVASGKNLDLSKFSLVSDREIKDEVEAVLSKSPDAPAGVIVGAVMSKFRGRVDGKKVSGIVNKLKMVK